MEHTSGKLEHIVSACNSIDIVSADDETDVVAVIINDDIDNLTDRQIADANHIQLCWNSHDDLLAIVKGLAELGTVKQGYSTRALPVLVGKAKKIKNVIEKATK